jgi:hypothetical protein
MVFHQFVMVIPPLGWIAFIHTISSIQTTYYPNKPITFVSGKTLGALNFGSGNIQLKDEFARQVIRMIQEAI